MSVQPENQGGLGDLVKARAELNRGIETLSRALKKCNGASADEYLEIMRLEAEVQKAYERGNEDRDMDGQRLYVLLALFDTRDGTLLAELVSRAREGWERSHPDMNEEGAWDDFDRLWNSRTSSERLDLVRPQKGERG